MEGRKVSPAVQRLLGEANMRHAYREFQQAVQLLLQVIQLAPNLPQPYQTLGLIYEEIGKHAKALKLYMMAAQLSKRDVHQWRQLAAMYAKHGDAQQAIYCLSRVLLLQPNDIEALWERALLLADVGDHKKAAAVLQTLLPKAPHAMQVVQRLAHSLYRLGHPLRAEKLLEGILERCLGGLTSSSQHTVGAVAHEIETAPDPLLAAVALPSVGAGMVGTSIWAQLHCLNMLIEVLFERGKYEEAMRHLRTHKAAIQIQHHEWRAPVELDIKEGVCLAYLGQLTSARCLWRPLLARADAVTAYPDLLYEVAAVLMSLGEWRDALAIYDQLRETEPYHEATHYKRGKCLLALGYAEAAAQAFGHAFELDPGAVEATLAITELLAFHGRPADAVTLLGRHCAAREVLAGQRATKPTVSSSSELGDTLGRQRADDDSQARGCRAGAHLEIGAEVEKEVEAALDTALTSAAAAELDVESMGEGVDESFASCSQSTKPELEPSANEMTSMELGHELADVRLLVVKGLALGLLGAHCEAVQLLLPIAQESISQVLRCTHVSAHSAVWAEHVPLVIFAPLALSFSYVGSSR